MNGPAREYLARALWLVAGVINLLPLSGIAGRDALQRLYGIAVTDPNVLVMLQHRAVVLGMVGAALLVAAVRVQWRAVAALTAMLSMGSYVLIAFFVGGYNAGLQRVVYADLIAIGCVIAAHWLAPSARNRRSAQSANAVSASNS